MSAPHLTPNTTESVSVKTCAQATRDRAEAEAACRARGEHADHPFGEIEDLLPLETLARPDSDEGSGSNEDRSMLLDRQPIIRSSCIPDPEVDAIPSESRPNAEAEDPVDVVDERDCANTTSRIVEPELEPTRTAVPTQLIAIDSPRPMTQPSETTLPATPSSVKTKKFLPFGKNFSEHKNAKIPATHFLVRVSTIQRDRNTCMLRWSETR